MSHLFRNLSDKRTNRPANRRITIALAIIFLSFVVVSLDMSAYKHAVRGGEPGGYYAYLPAYFVHHDFEFIRQIMGKGPDFSGPQTGKFVNKYTCGIALMQLPFFGMGHLAARLTGQAQDGYSPPYILALLLGIWFYVMAGLYLLARVLRRYYDETTTIITLFLIALGTNLFYFTVLNNQMAHGYLFFLYAALIYLTDSFYRAETVGAAAGIGLVGGLLALIRPVDILALIIPVFYGIRSAGDLRERWHFWVSHKWKILLVLVLFCLPIIPQLLYWHERTGHWLYYSYRKEGFDFLHPHVWQGITDSKNGWLRYTPVMIFALIGIWFLRRRREWFLPILLFLPVYMYVVYSWHNWFYINSFGSRPMVGPYALLAIPLAAFVQWTERGAVREPVSHLVYVFFILLNAFQTYQEHWGISRTEYASSAYYWKIFGKTKMDYSMLSSYESNIYQPRTGICHDTLVKMRFDDTTATGTVTSRFHSAPASLRLNNDNSLLSVLSGTPAQTGLKPGQYIKLTAWCLAEQAPPSWWENAVFVFSIERPGEAKPVHFNQMWINNKINAFKQGFSLWSNITGEWGKVFCYYRVPKDIRPDDKIHIQISNPYRHSLLVDDVHLEACDRVYW